MLPHRVKKSSSFRRKGALHLEELERRIVFDQYLGEAINLDFSLESLSELGASPVQAAEVEIEPAAFDFSSRNLSSQAIDALNASFDEWADNLAEVGTHRVDESRFWRKAPNSYPPEVTEEGVIVARRRQTNTNPHTMMSAGVRGSDCFHSGGAYTKQDYHYRFSFDVRHPGSETSWLVDHSWGLVMQLWGPRDSSETARNPPFSIYTTSIGGQPYWVVRSYGDSRLTTQTGEFEEVHAVQIPMDRIGDWYSFDVEFVPNPFGEGVIRTWLDGELVADWQGIKSAYYSILAGQPTGPLAPSLGLYSSLDEDGMEVHLDNISMQCFGTFESSIAGHIGGTAYPESHIVVAANQVTGESFSTNVGRSGIYTLSLPKGSYEVALLDPAGQPVIVDHVSTETKSQLLDIDVADARPKALVADLTGNGKSEVIHRLTDGRWVVSGFGDDDTYDASVWGQWSSSVAWSDIRTADFTGDGREDIVARGHEGDWWVAESTGSRFVSRQLGYWSESADWRHVSAGDFDGDGTSDIAGYDAKTGTWWVSKSTASSKFVTATWGRWSPDVKWLDVTVGDFNGDGRSDMAGRSASDGSWWVGLSTGSGFRTEHWGTWSNFVSWKHVQLGDFNKDGKSDLIGFTDGEWWVATSTGRAFRSSLWTVWSTAKTWADPIVADINGDGQSDLVSRAAEEGTWWVALSDGSEFASRFSGARWRSHENWDAAYFGDFDGDGTADLLSLNDSAWVLRSGQLEGRRAR